MLAGALAPALAQHGAGLSTGQHRHQPAPALVQHGARPALALGPLALALRFWRWRWLALALRTLALALRFWRWRWLALALAGAGAGWRRR